MTFANSWRRPGLALATGLAASALVLAACGGGGTPGTASSAGVALRAARSPSARPTRSPSLDPAGSYDNGSFAVMNQVYPVPDEHRRTAPPTCSPTSPSRPSFTSPTEYTVKLKPGLKFANGHDLTSSDVKFSFDRQLKINDPNGPASLLGNLASVVGAGPDHGRVPAEGRQRPDLRRRCSSSPGGPDRRRAGLLRRQVTPDKDIVKGNAFAGQYTITSYDFNNLIQYKANPDYKGLLGAGEDRQGQRRSTTPTRRT